MSLFDIFRTSDINQEVENYRKESRAMLIDVREADEFRQGHIEGARNIPLSSLDKVASAVQDKDMPLYVYCLSGGRSGNAVSRMRRMGYTNARNIGGISAYRGKVVR